MKIVSKDTVYLEKFKRGITILEEMVSLTMGPLGKNVIIRRPNGKVHVTKDGVTVAKAVDSNDAVEQLGIDLVREVALNTLLEAGDGTTTATVLANAFVHASDEYMNTKDNVTDVKNELLKITEEVINNIKAQALDIKNNYEAIKAVATISANNDDNIGTLIADAYKEIGFDGTLIVEEAKGAETSIDVTKGYFFERGFPTQHFLTNKSKMKIELENPLILIYDKRIKFAAEVLSTLEIAVKNNQPVVFICEDMEGTALSSTLINHKNGLIKAAVAVTPGYALRRKEILEDIALVTGGTYIEQEAGLYLKNVKPQFLGTCEKIVIDAKSTVIVGGKGNQEKIQERVSELKEKLKEETSSYKKEKLTERIASLISGVGIIYAGGTSEVEMKETKDRIEDALHATKAALAEGVVDGGGVTLLNETLKYLTTSSNKSIAAEIFSKGALKPFFKIYGEDAVIDVHGNNLAHNLKTGQRGKGIEIGVIDPVKVVTTTLKNAISIATMYLTTGGIITQTHPMFEEENYNHN
jgi:chaperonin GroEL